MAAIATPAEAAVPASSKPAAAAQGSLPGTVQQINELCYTFNGSVELASPEEATAVCRALEVDPELSPGQVTRELRTDGKILHIAFAASELRLLRAAVGTFYDLLALAVRTAEQFGN